MALKTTIAYRLADIIADHGLPVFIRKVGWTDNFVVRIDSVKSGMAYGTGFRDGAEYHRASGAYKYSMGTAVFYVPDEKSGVPLEDKSKNKSGKKKPAADIIEVQQAILESASELARIHETDLRDENGVIKPKAFKEYKPAYSTPVDVEADEQRQLDRILQIIKDLIGETERRKQSRLDTYYLDNETGRAGIVVNTGTDEFWGVTKHNIEMSQEITSLERAYREPYVAHLSIQFDDSYEPEDIFVGARLIYAEQYPQVVSWASEIGNLLYNQEKTTVRLRSGVIGEVDYKRNVVIRNGRLTDVVETYNRGNRLSAKQEAMVYDEFLVRVLREKYSRKELTNIIASIQSNQNEIIRAPVRDNNIVQGCAGCGKTMILLHRISYLIYNHYATLPSFRVLSPSARFNRHIAPLLADLDLDSLPVSTVSDYYIDYLTKLGAIWNGLNKSTTIQTDDGMKPEFVDYFYSPQYAKKLKKCIAKRRKAYEINEQGIIKLTQEKAEKKAANLNADELEKRLEALKANRRISIFDEEFLSALPEDYKHGKRSVPIHKAELYATVLVNYYFYGRQDRASHLYIDEGQDLSKQEYQLLRSLNPHAVFNVYGDISQQIYDGHRCIAGWKDLSVVGSFNRYELNENYRNTENITEFINHELLMHMRGRGLDGEPVQHLTAEDIPLVKELAEPDDRLVVIYPGSRKLKTLPKNLEGFEVLSVAEAKGMEFDTAIVLTKNMSENELYVAYSRALGKLYLCDA